MLLSCVRFVNRELKSKWNVNIVPKTAYAVNGPENGKISQKRRFVFLVSIKD